MYFQYRVLTTWQLGKSLQIFIYITHEWVFNLIKYFMIFETIILSFIFYMVNYVCKLCTIFLNILIDSGFYHLEFPNLYSWEMLTSMLSFYIFSWCLFLCLFLWYLHSILVLAILIILPVFLWESHSHIWFNLWYYDYFKLILSVQIIKIRPL